MEHQNSLLVLYILDSPSLRVVFCWLQSHWVIPHIIKCLVLAPFCQDPLVAQGQGRICHMGVSCLPWFPYVSTVAPDVEFSHLPQGWHQCSFYAMLPTLPHQISSNLVVGPEAKPPTCNKDMWYRLFHFSSCSSYNIIKNPLNFNVPYKICACESKHR